MALASGIGLCSEVCWGFRHGFVFGDSLWLRVNGSALGIWFVRSGKALRMQECAIILGSCSFRESREKSGSTVRSTGKSWKPGGGKAFVFLLISRQCSRGKERLTWSGVVPHGWI